MAVGVVITVLRSPNFIAHREHRQTEREHCDGKEILHLTVSEFLNCRIIGRTFNTAVPASIVVCAVAVVFAIGFIVFLVVRD